MSTSISWLVLQPLLSLWQVARSLKSTTTGSCTSHSGSYDTSHIDEIMDWHWSPIMHRWQDIMFVLCLNCFFSRQLIPSKAACVCLCMCVVNVPMEDHQEMLNLLENMDLSSWSHWESMQPAGRLIWTKYEETWWILRCGFDADSKAELFLWNSWERLLKICWDILVLLKRRKRWEGFPITLVRCFHFILQWPDLCSNFESSSWLMKKVGCLSVSVTLQTNGGGGFPDTCKMGVEWDVTCSELDEYILWHISERSCWWRPRTSLMASQDGTEVLATFYKSQWKLVNRSRCATITSLERTSMSKLVSYERCIHRPQCGWPRLSVLFRY